MANRKLLLELRDKVALGEDQNYDMDFWVRTKGNVDETGSLATRSNVNMCGTTVCLGGLAIVKETGSLSLKDRVYTDGNGKILYSVSFEAAQLLGIEEKWFFKQKWPEEFQVIANDDGDRAGMLAVLDYLLGWRK